MIGHVSMQNNSVYREIADEMLAILRCEDSMPIEKQMALSTMVEALRMSRADAQGLMAKYCPELLIED